MTPRTLLLPLVALIVAAALLAVQLAAGGADFVPTRAADPCAARPLPPVTDDIEPLAQDVVLLGVQRTACALGVTRERLVLALPSARDRAELARATGRTEAGLATALRSGLDQAVGRLDRAGRLPRASALLDSYAGELGLPGLAEAAVKRIPDGVVDGLLPTGAVLRRALAQLDVTALLRDLEDPDALEARLTEAIKAAALAEAKERLIEKIPGPIRGFLGL
ncbi:hypothetical protein DSM112329_03331 [Paraconexibacter sp. AEG42_29]|uniref:DUF4197 domain-containing protein n=1 Tax=Paraconexibacter sp. AEG42_29 TaxID=2997339 RepID=A0AAU7AXM1_9ACTN